MAIYSLDLGFDVLKFSADLSQASAPIHTLTDDGEEVSTPYQTADARHDAHRAARLVLGYMGRDYYAQPDDDRDSDEILDEIMEEAEVSVEEEEEEEEENEEEEEEAVTIAELLPELMWTGTDQHTDTIGYQFADFFDCDLHASYPSRAVAVATMRRAYLGPDTCGIGVSFAALEPAQGVGDEQKISCRGSFADPCPNNAVVDPRDGDQCSECADRGNSGCL